MSKEEYPKYKTSSRIIKSWFGKPHVEYSLIEVKLGWDDPSYGNGGGSYEEFEKVVFSTKVLSELHTMQRKLELIK